MADTSAAERFARSLMSVGKAFGFAQADRNVTGKFLIFVPEDIATTEFPEEIDGTPLTYWPIPQPELQGGNRA